MTPAMSLLGSRSLACLALLALALPWVMALHAAVHLTLDHGHGDEPGRVLASLAHGHEHASGTITPGCRRLAPSSMPMGPLGRPCRR